MDAQDIDGVCNITLHDGQNCQIDGKCMAGACLPATPDEWKGSMSSSTTRRPLGFSARTGGIDLIAVEWDTDRFHAVPCFIDPMVMTLDNPCKDAQNIDVPTWDTDMGGSTDRSLITIGAGPAWYKTHNEMSWENITDGPLSEKWGPILVARNLTIQNRLYWVFGTHDGSPVVGKVFADGGFENVLPYSLPTGNFD